jgi:hypothetical protein
MVKNKNVLFIIDNSVIKIENYKKEIHKNNLICPNCKGRMFAKNHGKIRIHHFSHYSDSDSNNCSSNGESELHYNFKTEFYELLRNKIENNKIFLLENVYTNNKIKEWIKSYKIDILKNVNRIGIEDGVGKYRPDITLYSNDIPIRIIEIIYKHDMDEEPFEFYKNKGIDVLKIYVQKETDVDNIKNGILTNEIDFHYNEYRINKYYANNKMGINIFKSYNDKEMDINYLKNEIIPNNLEIYDKYSNLINLNEYVKNEIILNNLKIYGENPNLINQYVKKYIEEENILREKKIEENRRLKEKKIREKEFEEKKRLRKKAFEEKKHLIIERIILKNFKNVRPMMSKGFDYISDNYKISVKSSILYSDKIHPQDCFTFNINKNKIPNYFCCIGFGENLNLINAWIISSKETTQGKQKYNELSTLNILVNKMDVWKDFEMNIDINIMPILHFI